MAFTCMPKRIALEPGDLISVTSDGTEYIARIVSSLLTPSYTNEITAEVLLANVAFDYTVDYLSRHGGNPPGTSNPTQFLDELTGNDNGGDAEAVSFFVGLT